MRIRLTILWTEVKLFLLLLASLLFLTPLALILLVQLPYFLGLVWYLEGGFKPIAIYLLIILAAVVIRKTQLISDLPRLDQPIRRQLGSDPAFRELVATIAKRMRKSAPLHT